MEELNINTENTLFKAGEVHSLSEDERLATKQQADEFLKTQMATLPKKNMTEISKDRELLLGALGQNIRLEQAIMDNYAEQAKIKEEIAIVNSKPKLELPVYNDMPYPEKPKEGEYKPSSFINGYKAIFRSYTKYGANGQILKKPLNQLWLMLSMIIGAFIGLIILEDILRTQGYVPQGVSAIKVWLEKNQITILYMALAIIGGAIITWLALKLMKYIPIKVITSVVYTALSVIILPIILMVNMGRLNKIKKTYKTDIDNWEKEKNNIDEQNKKNRLANKQTCDEMIKKAEDDWKAGEPIRNEKTRQLTIRQLKEGIFCEKIKNAYVEALGKFRMPPQYSERAVQERIYGYVESFRAYTLADAINLYEAEERAKVLEEREEEYRARSLARLGEIFTENKAAHLRQRQLEEKRIEQEREHQLEMQREARRQLDYIRESNELQAKANEEAARSNKEMERQLEMARNWSGDYRA